MCELIEKRKGKVTYFENDEGVIVSKQCTSCIEIKPIDEFYNNKLGTGGKTARCRVCAYGLAQRSVRKLKPKKPQRPGTMKYLDYKKQISEKR